MGVLALTDISQWCHIAPGGPPGRRSKEEECRCVIGLEEYSIDMIVLSHTPVRYSLCQTLI